MSASFLVLCPYGIDRGLVSKAVSLSTAPVGVLVPKTDAQAALSCGAALIHTLEQVPEDESRLARWLSEQIPLWGSTVVLAPATVSLRNVMPALAWHLNAGLTADCTALSMDGNRLLQTRPAFGNSLMATIRTLSAVQLATVRPGTFPFIENPCNNGQIIPESIPDGVRAITCTGSHSFTDGAPLSQSSIILAGGLGIGSREGFQKLEEAAKRLGAAVAASRNAVDAGFAPYRFQVGMTGVTVCPKLYIAVGISGAVQHLAGMSGAEKIIAINSDPKAPIFDYADYGMVADWETVIDKLLEELL